MWVIFFEQVPTDINYDIYYILYFEITRAKRNFHWLNYDDGSSGLDRSQHFYIKDGYWQMLVLNHAAFWHLNRFVIPLLFCR